MPTKNPSIYSQMQSIIDKRSNDITMLEAALKDIQANFDTLEAAVITRSYLEDMRIAQTIEKRLYGSLLEAKKVFLAICCKE